MLSKRNEIKPSLTLSFAIGVTAGTVIYVLSLLDNFNISARIEELPGITEEALKSIAQTQSIDQALLVGVVSFIASYSALRINSHPFWEKTI